MCSLLDLFILTNFINGLLMNSVLKKTSIPSFCCVQTSMMAVVYTCFEAIDIR